MEKEIIISLQPARFVTLVFTVFTLMSLKIHSKSSFASISDGKGTSKT